GHASEVPGRDSLGGRRRPSAERQLPLADARRRGHGEERDVEPPHRHAGQHLRPGVAAIRGRGDRQRPGRAGCHGAAEVRRAAARALDASSREQSRAPGGQRRSDAARHLRSPGGGGHADIERGEVTFEGRRYRISRGSMDFTNPNRIEPFFDVEAETSVRVPGQTYRVTVAFAGTSEQLRPTVNSDPPLPTADVLALLFSDVRRSGVAGVAPELRALQNPNQAQTDILTARATQALTAPISSEVGKVVEQTFGVDTFQL